MHPFIPPAGSSWSPSPEASYGFPVKGDASVYTRADIKGIFAALKWEKSPLEVGDYTMVKCPFPFHRASNLNYQDSSHPMDKEPRANVACICCVGSGRDAHWLTRVNDAQLAYERQTYGSTPHRSLAAIYTTRSQPPGLFPYVDTVYRDTLPADWESTMQYRTKSR
jgi:hypothetical protein